MKVRRKTLVTQSGILPVHKPVGPTSRDVVDEVEHELGDCKIGHAGTLDPLAEGVLPLMLNEATKLTSYFHSESKRYRIQVRFDYKSESYDLGETVVKVNQNRCPGTGELREALRRFDGEIQQVPPRYSAINVDGKRLYEIARNNDGSVSPDPRTVRCHEIELVDYSYPGLTIELTCGKGFYVRSLVRDLADELELEGGLVTGLLRKRYGPLKPENSALLHEPNDWDRFLAPPRVAALSYPFVRCTTGQINHVTDGGWIDRDNEVESPAMAIGPEGKLHAILESTDERGARQWRPRRVLNR